MLLYSEKMSHVVAYVSRIPWLVDWSIIMDLPTQFEIAEEGRNNSSSMQRMDFKLAFLIPELIWIIIL
jgi:hypothetical protein